MRKTSFVLSLLSAAALASPVVAQNWAAEIYGGGVFDRNEDFGGVSGGLDAGTAYGAGIYNDGLMKGAELGFDLMHSEAEYDATGADLESLSLMLNARMPWEIAPNTTAYVGAGLGAINVDYDDGLVSGDDTVAGGQIGLGLRYNFSAFTAFGELKHQMAFEDANIGGTDQSFEATSAVVGLRFAF